MENKPMINPIKDLMSREEVQKKFNALLGENAQSFITSVLQIVAQSAQLSKADPVSVYHAAAVAATMDLPINPNLGLAYIIPYDENKLVNNIWVTKTVAQFQMGYKGFIQLAQRSGAYKSINVTDVRQGEIKSMDRQSGEIIFDWITDEDERDLLPIGGYVSYFKLLNGFEKPLYMSNKQIEQHAFTYSKSYANEKSRKKSRWLIDRPGMSKKTVLKLLLSKYGPLSVDMRKAIITDQAIIRDVETLDIDYIDNGNEEPTTEDKEFERISLMIHDAETPEQLQTLEEHLKPEHKKQYETKLKALTKTKAK